MGYGEFAGGGSILWRVTHGHGGGGQGRDPDFPPGSGAAFKVWINGRPVGGGPIHATSIFVAWDENLDPNSTPETIRAKDPHQPG